MYIMGNVDSVRKPHHIVNLGILIVFLERVSIDAAETPQQKPPTGKLKNWDKRGSTQIPSLRD